MTIHDILSRLDGVVGRDGKYKARCPAHEDKHASLSVGEGDDGRVLLYCHAGCSLDAVLDAMYLTRQDLFQDSPIPVPMKPARRTAPTCLQSISPSEKWEQPPEAGLPRPEATPEPEEEIVYPYLDKNGQELFQKVRKPGKRFVQRRRGENGEWVYNLQGIEPVLYRLPEVLASPLVYVVEGEKDVETLRSMGLVATTGTHGAGPGKWRQSYTEQLAAPISGATATKRRVIIFPDRDAVGEAYAAEVLDKLTGAGVPAVVVEPWRFCPGLPEHGDITDAVGIVGPETVRNALVEDWFSLLTPQPTGQNEAPPSGAPQFGNPQNGVVPTAQTPGSAPDPHAVIRERFAATAYRIKGSHLYRTFEKNGERQERFLGNFYLLAHTEITRDDGMERRREMELELVCEGRSHGTERITSEEFTTMQFLHKTWGLYPRPAIGPNVLLFHKDTVSVQMPYVDKRTIYTHTGFRNTDTGWVYLYQEGVVGPPQSEPLQTPSPHQPHISVELPGRLSRYKLTPPTDEAQQKAAVAALAALMDVGPPSALLPLISLAFLSPLNEFLRQGGIEPSFVLFLLGVTGTGKSTLAALVLSLFGTFDNKSLPSSFKDTVNALEKQGFLLKDVLTVIDDYHPTSGRREALTMEQTAQYISRAYGDRTGRGRMQADTSLRQSYIPRGNVIVTGEDLPNLGQSGTARNLVIELDRGCLDFDKLSAVQAKAHLLPMAMYDYIQYLLSGLSEQGIEAFVSALGDFFHTKRSIWLQESSHGRTAEVMAHLELGMEQMVQWLQARSHLDETTAQQLLQKHHMGLIELSRRQSRRIEQDKPTELFLRAFEELLATGKLYVKEIGAASYNGDLHDGDLVGYSDDEYYYLYADTVYKAVVQFYFAQGMGFPLNRNTMLKHLVEEGYVLPDTKGGKSVRQKKLNGRNQRFLWLQKTKSSD